jgi:rod shape-determining protein MreD
MRSFTEQIMILLPGTLCVMLVFLFSTKLQAFQLSLVPNVVWVMTLCIAGKFRRSWPLLLVFTTGLFQDILYGTPLGAQALLSVLLTELIRTQAARTQFQQFRIRWLEAAGVLVIWHFLLWIVAHAAGVDATLRGLFAAGLVSALWFPIFYGGLHLLLDSESRL